MITIKLIDDRVAAPVVICDLCGERIEKEGNVLFNTDLNPNGTVKTVHRACDQNEPGMRWMPLDRFLLSLLGNTKIDMKKAVRRFKALADLTF
jgi:hypothetical protein